MMDLFKAVGLSPALSLSSSQMYMYSFRRVVYGIFVNYGPYIFTDSNTLILQQVALVVRTFPLNVLKLCISSCLSKVK